MIYPGFAFQWLTLISHKSFLPFMITEESLKSFISNPEKCEEIDVQSLDLMKLLFQDACDFIRINVGDSPDLCEPMK